MSDWASGIVDVTGTKASIEAFLNRFLYDAEPPTVPGVRYFARSVLYESREKIQEELDSVFLDVPEGEEREYRVYPEFAWSAAYSCQSDMIQLSKDFPDTFFELSVEGENHNDDWRAYFSDGKYQVNDALRLFWPFIPSELREDHSDEDALDYAGCVRLEHLKVTRAAIYHSLRILLAKDEKDFPWDENLIQAAEAMCREFLTSKGFAVPAAEQPDGKQEKDGGNDDEREKT